MTTIPQFLFVFFVSLWFINHKTELMSPLQLIAKYATTKESDRVLKLILK
ncbi:MAG: hypothetical protein F6K10_10685 [Moorea sp. SIO2B7]|nr:hypothetical protein [Moorena sp. SIO2B7]